MLVFRSPNSNAVLVDFSIHMKHTFKVKDYVIKKGAVRLIVLPTPTIKTGPGYIITVTVFQLLIILSFVREHVYSIIENSLTKLNFPLILGLESSAPIVQLYCVPEGLHRIFNDNSAMFL